MAKHILIINPLGIGDVIFSTPLIGVLKKAFPQCFIGYVCNRRVSELLLADPDIDRVFIYEKDEFRDAWRRSKIECARMLWALLNTIKKDRFDVSIDLSLGYQYSMLLMLIGIKKRIGFNYRNRGRFLTSKVDIKNFDDKHVIDHYMDVLKLLNVDFKELSIGPKICVSQDDLKWTDKVLADKGLGGTDTIVGLACGCGASWGPDAIRRRWDKKRFAELADRIIDRCKTKVILLGDKKECEISKDVALTMKNTIVDLCGETSVGQMAALISRCNVVITNDGGPLHIAVGLGVKTVSIFGPVNELVYGPYPKDGKHTVITSKNVNCRPCYKGFRYNRCDNRMCLDSISVDDVYAAVEKALSR